VRRSRPGGTLQAIRRDAIGLAGFQLVAFFALLFVGLFVVRRTLSAEEGGWDGFALIRLLAWQVFAYTPLLLVALARYNRERARTLARVECAMAVGIWAIAVDAFVVEPRAIEVNHHTISSKALTRSYTVAVLADIQTDHVGAYERRAVQLAMAERPDLIVLPGDYIEAHPDAQEAQQAAFRRLFEEEEVQAPRGVYALEGDMEEHRDWSALFAPDVERFTETRTVRVGDDLWLTGLPRADSGDTALDLSSRLTADGFHLVVGHAPDFALGTVPADLLVAGHTHGGQVQLPFYGPPFTLSEVPRGWASGRTTLPSGATLIVSRGIGMERQEAPRLRFLCRPEVVILHLEPVAAE
jgi:predicted MPP superfamily phosphohydrolase